MRLLKRILIGLFLLAVTGLFLTYLVRDTSGKVAAFEQEIIQKAPASTQTPPIETSGVPAPVLKYFKFTFPNGIPQNKRYVEMEMHGMFRRPLSDTFNPTNAKQVAAITTGDMVFSAKTPVFGPIWALAYDRFINGEMEMEAQILATLSVMHEEGDKTLNQISLRRWLLESPTFPLALLPGGIVSWHPIDETHARATARAHGIEASLIATFNKQGALISFETDNPGDLSTPYHGSGERVDRSGFRLVDNMQIPHGFEISRVGPDNKIYPFWQGTITTIRFGE